MNIYNALISLSRVYKIILLLFFDTICLILSNYLAISLRLDNIWSETIIYESRFFILFSPLIIILSSRISEIHRILLRTTGINDFYKLFTYSLLTSLFFVLINFLFDTLIPRSVPIIYLFIFLLLIISYRIIGIAFLRWLSSSNNNKVKKVVIFGAGDAGVQLLNSTSEDTQIEVKAFIDDNKNLISTRISNINVYSRDRYKDNFNINDIDEVWIAMPSIEEEQKREILEFATKNFNKVRSLPSITELLLQSTIKNALYDINPEDFLGRQKIIIDSKLYSKAYSNKTILVTGAGGSIGSEICMQLAELGSTKIILFEMSEFALYQIEQKLRAFDINDKLSIVSCLGSVTDKKRVNDVINEYNVNVIIHAAAYKHVPLVEHNIIEGFKNNTIGTNIIVDAAIKNEIENFVFISTDKAVRPANIMGVSKRVAELIIQSKSKSSLNINFSVIRFGNVLGSSGSVIPLFKKQIESGGPVTVTDPNMTRYFMAIPEAVKLVLLAGSFKSNGNVYLLDMGKPIKIKDLAINMIKLSGFSIKDKNNPYGDIEIKVTSIRPGEKLFEELLTKGNFRDTSHPKVKIADEPYMSDISIENLIKKINNLIDSKDKDGLKDIVSEIQL